jgi:L-threonylcarbamoyladenylate synthase
VDLPYQDSRSIGVRVPGCPFCRAVLDAAGFLVVPSANPAGEGPPGSFGEVRKDILQLVDFAVDAGPCEGGIESTVVEVSGPGKAGPGRPPVSLLREGAMTEGEILGAVGRGEGI